MVDQTGNTSAHEEHQMTQANLLKTPFEAPKQQISYEESSSSSSEKNSQDN
jgi:hypothetical protein